MIFVNRSHAFARKLAASACCVTMTTPRCVAVVVRMDGCDGRTQLLDEMQTKYHFENRVIDSLCWDTFLRVSQPGSHVCVCMCVCVHVCVCVCGLSKATGAISDNP